MPIFNKLIYDGTEYSLGGGGNPYDPFHLDGISDLAVVGGDTEATITWTDPGDLIVDGQTLATWSSTKLVRKVGSAPTDSSDGTLVVEETVADTYSVSGYTDTGLTNGTTYYYGAFATSTEGLETISNTESVVPAVNKTWVLNDVTLEKTFDTGLSLSAGQYISRDGLKLYYGDGASAIYYQNLTTAWDVSTATGGSAVNVSNANNVQNIWFSPDMMTMITFNYGTGDIIKYTLSSAGDITTATISQQISFKRNNYGPTGGVLTDDGLYMYVCYQDNYVGVWSLSPAFDLSTATLSSSTTAPAGVTRGIGISSDYKHLYGGADTKMWQIDMATANDLSNVTTQDRTMPNYPAHFYYGGGLANNNNLLVTMDGRYIRTWNVV